MIADTLVRRRTQLDLLGALCATRARAQLVPPGGTPERPLANSRFLELTGNALVLEHPVAGGPADWASGTSMDVYFSHEGTLRTFRTRSLGPATTAGQRVLRLAMPLYLEVLERRDTFRASLTGVGPIHATFTSLDDDRQSFLAELTNFSTGGLGAVLAAPSAPAVRRGGVYWAACELPGEAQRLEFVVRVVHAQPDAARANVVLGAVFCAGDDPTRLHEQVQTLARFVRRQENTRPARIASPQEGGASACW
jgi:c-di-GMP-binding flagellar brake protein YcgR